MGGVTTGVETSGIETVGAGEVFAPEILGITAGKEGFFPGGEGGGGFLIGGAGIGCGSVGDKEATTSPAVSENFTKMGFETKWSIELTEAFTL